MGFQVKKVGGYPALYENEKRIAPLAYQLARCGAEHPCAQKCIPQFHDVGIDVVGVSYALRYDWTENGYDGKWLLREIAAVKKVNPQAKLLLRVNLTPPHWWMRKHKDELVKYYGVETGDLEHLSSTFNTDKLNDMRASFVSQKWWEDTDEMLKGMHHVLVEHGFGEDIFAIQIAYGTCGEWHIYGQYYGKEETLFEGDYSAPMLTFFREYLKEKYQTDQALQKAWNNVDVTIETAQLATPSARKDYQDIDGFLFRVPEKNMQALDSLKCLQLAAPKAISHFAKTLRALWGKNVLVGTFYGYYFACGDVFGRMLEPQALFEDENIDYLAAPNAYTANKKGGNAAFLRYLAESMRLNGKLFLSEVDQGYKSYCCYRDEKNDKKYVCENDAEYVAITARNVFESVLRGMGAWFFEHQHPEDYQKIDEKTGYWDTPARMGGIKRIREAVEKMIALRPTYEQTNDVLIVYDTQSVYHFGPSKTGDLSDIHNTYNHFDMADAIAKSGVGYDSIWLNDLQKCDLSKYKCVLFVACAAMSEQDFSYIQNHVKGGNRTVVFMRENGYIVGEKTSDQTKEQLYRLDTAEAQKNCKVVVLPNFVYDGAFYRDLFISAGAHVYSTGGEAITAANGFVMAHSKGKEKTLLHLACGDVEMENGRCETAILDIHTGERIF